MGTTKDNVEKYFVVRLSKSVKFGLFLYILKYFIVIFYLVASRRNRQSPGEGEARIKGTRTMIGLWMEACGNPLA